MRRSMLEHLATSIRELRIVWHRGRARRGETYVDLISPPRSRRSSANTPPEGGPLRTAYVGGQLAGH